MSDPAAPPVENRRVTLVLPGSLDRISGGTLYDKATVLGLRDLGWRVDTVSLADSFPFPTAADREAALVALAATDGPVVVDGLALGALGSAVGQALPPDRLIALVHHPLADEGGVPAAIRHRLLASERAALAAAGRIVTTSRFTAARIRRLFGPQTAPIVAIPPSVHRPSRVPASAPVPRQGAPLRLVGLGALIPRKRWPLLIRALACRRSDNWRLDLIGPTDAAPVETARIRSAIRRWRLCGRVRLHGSLPPDRVAAALDRAHILLHPAAYEGYGMVLAEATARGRPVLCTAGGATAEAAARQARIMVPPDDLEALTVALARLLDRPGRVLPPLAMGARAAARRARGRDRLALDWDRLLKDAWRGRPCRPDL